MKVFVGILVPPAFQSFYSGIQSNAPEDWQRQKPANFHLTLCLIDNARKKQLPRLAKVFNEAVVNGRHAPFDISFQAIKAFPRKGRQIFNIHAQPDNYAGRKLTQLHNSLKRALKAAGFKVYTPPVDFDAHMTLLRAPAQEGAEVKAFIEQHRDTRSRRFPVGSILLLTKQPQTKENRNKECGFSIIAEIPLWREGDGRTGIKHPSFCRLTGRGYPAETHLDHSP